MNKILYFVLSVCLYHVATSNSIVLDSGNFYKEVDSNDTPYLVLFGAEMVQGEDDAFEKFSAKISDAGVKVGRIDCTIKKHKKICSNILAGPEANKQLPQLGYYIGEPSFNPYTKKKFRKPAMFSGQFAEKDIERFVVKATPHSLNRATYMKHLLNNTDMHSTEDLNIMPVVVVVTQKESVPIMFKSISNKFMGTLQLTNVNVDKGSEVLYKLAGKRPKLEDDEDEEGESVRIPSIGVLKSSVKKVPVGLEDEWTDSSKLVYWYHGDMKDRNALIEFLNPFASVESQADSAQTQSNGQNDKERKNKIGEPEQASSGDLIWNRDSLLNIESLTTENAWIIGVVKKSASAEIPNWNNRIVKYGEGVIKIAELVCEAETTEESDSVKGTTLGSILCDSHKELPYVQIIPYEEGGVEAIAQGEAENASSMYTSERRKMLLDDTSNVSKAKVDSIVNQLNKLSVKFEESDAEAEQTKKFKNIRKMAWDSLPESVLTPVTEMDMQVGVDMIFKLMMLSLYV